LCGFEHVFEYFMCYLLLFHLTYRIHLCYIYISIYGNMDPINKKALPMLALICQHHGS
jgi:hypothetical protein